MQISLTSSLPSVYTPRILSVSYQRVTHARPPAPSPPSPSQTYRHSAYAVSNGVSTGVLTWASSYSNVLDP